ncbi:MAG: Gfo/Idh/MocA family protein [Christensenellales bacterium]|jgi:predicted dehydrogenase
MKPTRVGLIGMGSIMNGVHIPGYLRCDDCHITAICDIDTSALQKTGEKLQIPENQRFFDYHELIDSGLVDVVDIATPDSLHCEIAMAAVNRQLPFSVEKPMGMTYKEVQRVVNKAMENDVVGHVCFSWHYRPFVRLMREQMLSGEIGELHHVYVRCIKESGLWKGRRLEWRFDKKYSAWGVLGDLASHMFDITHFMGLEFEEVVADGGIIVKERQGLNDSLWYQVSTWDWCNVLARLTCGANATYQISRTCKNVGDWIQTEFYGSKGKMIYTYYEGDQSLELHNDKGKRMLIPNDGHNAIQSLAFINLVNGKADGLEATLQDALKAQAVIDASWISAQENRWVAIKEIIEQGV